MRACNNEQELERSEAYRRAIEDQVTTSKAFEPSYWKLQKEMSREYGGPVIKHANKLVIGSVTKILSQIMKHLKEKVFWPFNLRKYAEFVDELYQGSFADCLKDTYLCAVFVPDNVADPSGFFNFVVKHPLAKGVDFMQGLKVDRCKHLSVNTVAPC